MTHWPVFWRQLPVLVTSTKLNMFNLAPVSPATGAGKNLVPEKYGTPIAYSRQVPATGATKLTSVSLLLRPNSTYFEFALN